MGDKLEPMQPVYAGLYGCIGVIGLPLNAVSLWILLRHHSLKSPSAVFMVNLATSDLLLAFSLPIRIYFYATGSWPFSRVVCTVSTSLFRNNIRSSAIFITIISVDRLLAVVYPLRSRHLRTSANAWKGAAIVWLFVVVLNVPDWVELSRHSNNNDSTCFESRHFSRTKPLYILPVLMSILLVVNVVCTAMVAWTLRSHLSDSARINNKVNVTLIFALNLVMFTICFMPISLALTAVKGPALRPLGCLASVNCCLDPLLYYFSLDAFWKKKEDVDLARERET